MSAVSGKISVCIVGATGYAGIELVRLVLDHPLFELRMVTDRKAQGTPLKDIYPALRGMSDITLSAPDPDRISEVADVAFLAVPHTASLDLTPELLKRGVSVIDLSADFRLLDPDVYEHWYKTPHTAPELLKQSVYGLPELMRPYLLSLAEKNMAHQAVLVAAPGCYPTATALAAAPALSHGIVSSSLVIVDAKSGVSGAGRTPSERTHFCHASDAVEAYGVASHRHTPEMEQALSHVAGRPIDVVFTPHLVPMIRGLVSTVYMEIKPEVDMAEISQIYSDAYRDDPLVEVLETPQMPSSASVVGSARAQIGVALDARRRHVLIASAAIDNLGKGAAAQALQCANIIFGLDETLGLNFVAPLV
ncbi:MAG: N-acetyl-gamma-glutamyl-phosphate reductase [Atopobiaceae bacterium]|jgi:N-acetyl-gamma-glutamyl-phosphate reductase